MTVDPTALCQAWLAACVTLAFTAPGLLSLWDTFIGDDEVSCVMCLAMLFGLLLFVLKVTERT